MNYDENYAALEMTSAELGYYTNLKELELLSMSDEDRVVDDEVAGVGSGLGGGMYNTS